MTSRNLALALWAPVFSASLLPAIVLGGLTLASPEVRAEVKSAACKVTAFLASKDVLPAGLAPRPATLAFAVAAGTVVAVAASLPAALRAGRKAEVRRVAQALA